MAAAVAADSVSTVALARCTRWFAPSAAMKLPFLFALVAIAQSTAAIASADRVAELAVAADATKPTALS